MSAESLILIVVGVVLVAYALAVPITYHLWKTESMEREQPELSQDVRDVLDEWERED